MKIFEIIDDPQEDKLYLVMEYCSAGEVMSFKESTMSFKAPRALLEKNEYKDKFSNFDSLDSNDLRISDKTLNLFDYSDFLSEKQIQYLCY